MNKVKFVLFSAGILLALVFTFSCSSNGNNDDSGGGNGQGGSFNENSQVYIGYWDDYDVFHIGNTYTGNGDIKIRLYDDDESSDYETLNVGNVTNGIVKLDLPQTIPDRYLINFVDDEDAHSCTGDLDIKFFISGSFILTNNKDYIGYLNIFYENEDAIENFGEEISYWYFSKAGNIVCNLQDEDEDAFFSKSTFSINAKKGWNKIYARAVYRKDGTGRTGEFSTNNILTKEVKWILDQR